MNDSAETRDRDVPIPEVIGNTKRHTTVTTQAAPSLRSTQMPR